MPGRLIRDIKLFSCKIPNRQRKSACRGRCVTTNSPEAAYLSSVEAGNEKLTLLMPCSSWTE